MNLYCKKCLISRNDDVLGAPCQAAGCGGFIEEKPSFHALPDLLICGRRLWDFSPFDRVLGVDHWNKFKSNGNRVCSFCGSLHPDDFFALVKQSANAAEDAEHGSVVEISQSDKNYKIYVHQPGVRDSSEGGVKFYTHHLPQSFNGETLVTDEQVKEFIEAKRRSAARFELRFQREYGGA